MLSATDLACSRGERRLFEGLAFALEAGEWLHVKGQNGSGKTTLLRTLVGLSPPDAGRTSWRGVDIRDDPHAYRSAVVYHGHLAALKDDLTPLENLRVARALDEPFASLDAPAVELLGTLLQDHLGRGGVAVITSHQAVPVAPCAEITL